MKKIKLNLDKLNSSKLQLKKETITNLVNEEMRLVYGGYQNSAITCSGVTSQQNTTGNPYANTNFNCSHTPYCTGALCSVGGYTCLDC
jgi:hypothetical protein